MSPQELAKAVKNGTVPVSSLSETEFATVVAVLFPKLDAESPIDLQAAAQLLAGGNLLSESAS